MNVGATNNTSNHTPIEAALRIDSLIKPTLRRLNVTSLEELAALDIVEVARQKGIGSRKREILGTLIVQARAKVNDVSLNLDRQARPENAADVEIPIPNLHIQAQKTDLQPNNNLKLDL